MSQEAKKGGGDGLWKAAVIGLFLLVAAGAAWMATRPPADAPITPEPASLEEPVQTTQ